MSITEMLRTIIYLNKLEREHLARTLAAAHARGDELRADRLAESRPSSAVGRRS